MVLFGYENDRNALKYQCPAWVNDFQYKGFEACSAYAKSEAARFGRVVRVKLDEYLPRISTQYRAKRVSGAKPVIVAVRLSRPTPAWRVVPGWVVISFAASPG